MSRIRDLTGQTFGDLTALEMMPRKNRRTYWRCKCGCGNETVVSMGNLVSGHTKSCGDCSKIIQHNGFMEYVHKNGRSFLFDAEDLAKIQKCQWNISPDGYVHGAPDGNTVKLHRYLINAPKGKVVDHINGIPNDCRKSNLRIVSQHQNTMNKKLPKNSTTGYKGVCFDKSKGKYMAHIHPNRRMVFLGYFSDPKEAAVAYNKAAIRYFGEFAKLNFAKAEEVRTEQ